MHNMVAWDDCNGCAYLQSLCLRGEWIEILDGITKTLTSMSLCLRGEWIEIKIH